MPIQPKPFNWNDKLVATKFKGAPSYFNGEDLNREFDAIRNYAYKIEELGGVLGTVTSAVGTYSITLTGTNTLTINASISWTSGEIFVKGTRLPITSGTLQGSSSTSQDPNANGKRALLKPIYLVVVADKVRKTFADDPVLCGILADEYPQRVSGCEVDVYENIQVIATEAPESYNNIRAFLATVVPVVKAGNEQITKVKLVTNVYKPQAILTGNDYYSDRTIYGNNTLVDEVLRIKEGVLNKKTPWEDTGQGIQYRKNTNGDLQFKGQFSPTGVNLGDYSIGPLKSPFRPANPIPFYVWGNDGTQSTMLTLTLETSGMITIPTYSNEANESRSVSPGIFTGIILPLD